MTTLATLSRWALLVMNSLAPEAPWKDTFPASADVIASVSLADPIYSEEQDGPRRTAAILLSLGFFEGTFKPDAEGDCDVKRPNGLCAKGGRPHSVCMFQINDSNFRALGVTKADLQTDFTTCARTALRIVKTSFAVCSKRPLSDRLAHYAAGGDGCGGSKGEGLMQSRHRMNKANAIYADKVFLEAFMAE